MPRMAIPRQSTLGARKNKEEQASLHPSASPAVHRGDEDFLGYLKVKRDEMVAYSPFSLPYPSPASAIDPTFCNICVSSCSSPTASAKWKWKTPLGVLHSEHQTDPSPPQLLPLASSTHPTRAGQSLATKRWAPPGRVIDLYTSEV